MISGEATRRQNVRDQCVFRFRICLLDVFGSRYVSGTDGSWSARCKKAIAFRTMKRR